MNRPPAADDHGGRSVSGPFRIPADALVLLVGVAGAGKTTFARRHFRPTEILSSDAMRAMIADDPSAQNATDDAFQLLHQVLAMRLTRGRLTVVDATNVEAWARAELLTVGKRHRRPAVAIVLDLPLEIAIERNAARPAPRPPPAALRRQHRWLRDTLATIGSEGLSAVRVLTTPSEVDGLSIERVGH
jgi:predicted kinase